MATDPGNGSSDPLDNGDAAVLVLLDGHGRLDEDRLVLPGGGAAEVFVDEDGDTLVQVETGKVHSTELVRAVLRSPALTVYGDMLDLVVATTTGDYDRYVFSADFAHRYLFTRQWHRREEAGGPVVALVGHSPDRAETHGDGEARRQLLASTLRLAEREVGAPAKLHVVDLFTRRVEGRGDVGGAPADRQQDAGQRAEALAEADVVIASWGVVRERGQWAVEATVDELRAQRDRGARVLVRAVDGELDAVGTPAQPGAGPGIASGTSLVDAPREWLWGGEFA